MESVICTANVSGIGTRSTPTGTAIVVELSGRTADVNVDRPTNQGALIVDYLVQGLRGFRDVSVDSAWGRITVGASHKVEDYSELTGQIRVEITKAPDDFPAGLAGIDAHTQRLLDVLSFAQGLRLDWCVRQVYVDGTLHSLRLFSMAQPDQPKFEVLSHLQLEPVLQLAVGRYTAALTGDTGLDVALYWYLAHGRYLDQELIAGMIAFESLLRHWENAHPRLLVPKSAFDNIVRPALNGATAEALDKIPGLIDAAQILGALQAKIANMNGFTFRDSLIAMFAAYSVPIADLETHLPALIKVRNDIVHRGSHSHGNPHAKDVGLYVAIMRELFVRTVLTLLGYSGQYCSFLNGPEWKNFPPAQALPPRSQEP